jgi:formylglycine-generating enzyme required for sulfatase activity
MKQALVNGQLIPANPDAPATATCPNCRSVVELRNRRGTFFWRHVKRPRGGCRPQPPSGATGDELTDVTRREDDATSAQGGFWTRRISDDLSLCLWPEGGEGGRPYLSLVRPQEGNVTVHLDEARSLVKALLNAAADLIPLAIPGDDRDFDELVTIPAGPFLMGEERDSDASPQHELTLPTFKIAKYPMTNAQYARFAEATGREWLWDTERHPEKVNCPATAISWHDAWAYCAWLTEVWRAEGVIAPGDIVRLPTEAEWEKAARGEKGQIYPWGDEWDETCCNSEELGLNDTCTVGMFVANTSPYGCRDMAGQVWEWTASLWGKNFWTPEFKYPYDPTDGRENLEAGDDVFRVSRGGSFSNSWTLARCALRNRELPDVRNLSFGFRVVVSPCEAS